MENLYDFEIVLCVNMSTLNVFSHNFVLQHIFSMYVFTMLLNISFIDHCFYF